MASQVHLPDFGSLPTSGAEALQSARAACEQLPQLDSAALGGVERWRAWLEQLRRLEAQAAAWCSSELWAFFAGLARRLPVTGEASFLDFVAALAAAAFGFVSALPAHSAGSANEVAAGASPEAVAGFLDVFAIVGDRLGEASLPSSPAGSSLLADGFGSCARLLARAPAAQTPIGVRTAEAWLRAALGGGSAVSRLASACMELTDVAEASGTGSLLNVAWRLLKALCLDAACDGPTAQAVLDRAARAAAAQLASAAAGAAPAPGAGDVLFVAKFHCSNFLRLARDAPAIAREGFPLRQVMEAFAPAATALDTSDQAEAALRPARELLEKSVAMALERWAGAASGPPPENDLRALLASGTTAGLLARAALPLLAAGRIECSAAAGPEALIVPTEALRAEALLAACLQALEAGARAGVGTGAEGLSPLAALFAMGAPGVRPRALAWALSPEPRLYVLALRLHRELPRWLGPPRALAWAQLLAQGALGAGGGLAGRLQCQVASCVAVILAHCPADRALGWIQTVLAPLLAPRRPGDAFAWALARRLAAALPGGPAAAALLALAGQGAEPPAGGRALRCRGALLRRLAAGSLPDADACQLKACGEEMRALLGNGGAPLKLRLEAWGVHAEVCLQMENADDLRVSMRYALRHLSGLERAGARVAAVLARAPGGLLEGSGPALEGLCGMSWPLRVAGLAAAAAISQREGVPRTVREKAEQAALAFKEECGLADAAGRAAAGPGAGGAAGPGPWPLSPGAYRAKRRRLLEAIAGLPEAPAAATDGTTGCEVAVGGAECSMDAELPELCAAALARIRTWSQQG